MNGITAVFILVNAIVLFLLPRRMAPLPLLIGVCYITRGQGFEIGPFNFPVIRILIAVGMMRITLRRERFESRLNALDKLMLAWSVWLLISSLFHKDSSSALIGGLGLIYDACGIYLLLRVFCQSLDDVVGLCRITAILLVPVAIEMIYEKLTVYNLFYSLWQGSGSGIITVREGHVRAQGPFAHAIIAGTVGAVSLPLMVALWRQHRRSAMIGIGACLAIIITSTSSGPLMATMAAIGALWMWNYRHLTHLVRWLAVFGYIGLDVIMQDPAYFIMARIDLSGGSTGWHRARLIQSAFGHLSEWWLVGTDYTRHWMPTGVSWSPDHTDITNHYLQMGVVGGLPLMLLFIAIIYKGFSIVGQGVRQMPESARESRFMVWALGASLFAHAASFISVSYFDQSFVFIYLTLAAIGSAISRTNRKNGYRTNADLSDQPALIPLVQE